MFKYLLLDRSRFYIFITISIIYSVTSSLLALVLANIMEAAAGDSLEVLFVATGVAIASILFYSILQYIYKMLKNNILTKSLISLKSDLFSAIIEKDINDFEVRNSASYINELTTKVNMVSRMYFSNFIALLNLMISFISAVVVTIYFQPILLLLMFVLGFISFFVSKRVGKGIEDATKAVSDSAETYQVGLKEFFSGFKLIKIFAIASNIIGLHEKINSDLENKKKAYNLKTARVDCVTLYIGFMSTILIMAAASAFAVSGLISVGAVFAVGHLMGQVTSPIHAIPSIQLNFKSVKPIIAELKV